LKQKQSFDAFRQKSYEKGDDMTSFGSKSILILLLTTMLTFSAHVGTRAHAYDDTAPDLLHITDSTITFNTYDNYNEITCVGNIENTSNVPISEIVFQVQYFNATGNLIDTVTGYDYSYVVPAKQVIAFRVNDTAARTNSEEYVSHQVIITSAKQERPSKTNNKFMTNLLISWGPILLLIAVWLFILRKYQGKNSPQKKILELQKQHYELIEKQNELFSELIETIKNK
jgi:ATP-dependent Zn protease